MVAILPAVPPVLLPPLFVNDDLPDLLDKRDLANLTGLAGFELLFAASLCMHVNLLRSFATQPFLGAFLRGFLAGTGGAACSCCCCPFCCSKALS
jgi:hypothetical protein